jgi:hypothetical protein
MLPGHNSRLWAGVDVFGARDFLRAWLYFVFWGKSFALPAN